MGFFSVGDHPCSDISIQDQRVWTTKKFYIPGELGYAHFFDTAQVGPFSVIVHYGYAPALHLSPNKPYHNLQKDQPLLNSIKVMTVDMVVVAHPTYTLRTHTTDSLLNTLFPRWHEYKQKGIPLIPLSVSRCENVPSYASFDQIAAYKTSAVTIGRSNECSGKVHLDIDQLVLQLETQTEGNIADCPMETLEEVGSIQNSDSAQSGSSNVVQTESGKIVVTNVGEGACQANIVACGHTVAVKDGQVFVNPNEWNDMPLDHGAGDLRNAADKLLEQADRLLEASDGFGEEMEQEEDFLYKTLRYFKDWWLEKIIQFQSAKLPIALINTDKVKHWFELLYDNINPALSQFRCWLCNAFWDLAMLSPSYKPSIARNEGKLRNSYQNNYQDITDHMTNEGHIYLNNLAKREGVKTKEEFTEVLYRKHTSGELWYYRTIHVTDATAEGLFKALTDAWREDDLYEFFKANLLSIATDGASTLTGLRGGLHTLLDNWADRKLVRTKCMAHKLNLSQKWGIGKFEYFIFIENYVKRHHTFYQGNAGHKRYDHLMKTALELGLYLYTPPSIFEVRWSSSEAWAFEVLLRNYEVLVDDLTAIINDPTTTFSQSDKKQAMELLVVFQSRRFLLLIHFVKEIFEVISIWSKNLQERTGLLFDKLRQRDEVLMKLEALKTPTPGSGETRTGKFLNQVKCWGAVNDRYVKERGSLCLENEFYDAQFAEWRGRQLTNAPSDVEFLEMPKLIEVRISTLQSLQDQIREYFPDEQLLQSLSVLDPAQFPTNIGDVNSYSDQTVNGILLIAEDLGFHDQLPQLAENWEHVLSLIQTHFTQSEYSEYKEAGPMLFWKKHLGMPYFPDGLKSVIKATLVLSIGSSECERGFSVMNRLKDKYRTFIDNVGLDCDMFLNINGPEDLEDVPKDIFSLDFYHEGHSLADDPIHIITEGEGSRGGPKKDPRYMLGGSSIFKKGDISKYRQTLKERFEKILAGEPPAFD